METEKMSCLVDILINCLSENPDDYPDGQYFRTVMDNVKRFKTISNVERR